MDSRAIKDTHAILPRSSMVVLTNVLFSSRDIGRRSPDGRLPQFHKVGIPTDEEAATGEALVNISRYHEHTQ